MTSSSSFVASCEPLPALKRHFSWPKLDSDDKRHLHPDSRVPLFGHQDLEGVDNEHSSDSGASSMDSSTGKCAALNCPRRRTSDVTVSRLPLLVASVTAKRRRKTVAAQPETTSVTSNVATNSSSSVPSFSVEVLTAIAATLSTADSNNNRTGTSADCSNGSSDCSSGHEPCASSSSSDQVTFSDQVILKELNEMRLLLERLIENRSDGTRDELFELLGLKVNDMGPAGQMSGNESDDEQDMSLDVAESPTKSGQSPSPAHFPVGDLVDTECGVCLEHKSLHRRSCCSYPACDQCLSTYFGSRVQLLQVSIPCLNPACEGFAHRDEISVRLEPLFKEQYHRLLVANNSNGLAKTCPRCNAVHELASLDALKAMRKKSKKAPESSRVECASCAYGWCFVCHSYWHAPATCQQFQKGDRLLLSWAREVSQGQVNAQKCPLCKIFIQRSSGCDHMHCTRCKTDFCYRCGDRLRRLKFFGDHYSKLSIFGCKYRYKANQPVQRRLVRGAVFGSKVCLAPVLGSLAVCAGALVVGVGVAALPLYGGVRLYRNYQRKRFFKVTLNGSKDLGLESHGDFGLGDGGVTQTIQITYLDDDLAIPVTSVTEL